MDITIELKGIEAVKNKLQELYDKGHDTKPLLEELANHLLNITQDSFTNEASPNGAKWSPIQPRKNDRTPDKILRDEGTMQDSLTTDVTTTSATIGLNATSNGYPYPIVHQFGTKNGSIEARPFMPFDENEKIFDDVVVELEEIIENYIQEVLV